MNPNKFSKKHLELIYSFRNISEYIIIYKNTFEFTAMKKLKISLRKPFYLQ